MNKDNLKKANDLSERIEEVKKEIEKFEPLTNVANKTFTVKIHSDNVVAESSGRSSTSSKVDVKYAANEAIEIFATLYIKKLQVILNGLEFEFEQI